ADAGSATWCSSRRAPAGYRWRSWGRRRPPTSSRPGWSTGRTWRGSSLEPGRSPTPPPPTPRRRPGCCSASGDRKSATRVVHRLQQFVEVVAAFVAYIVDEEGRRAVDAAAQAAEEVVAYPLQIGARRDRPGECRRVQAEPFRGGGDPDRPHLILVREQPVVHQPEAALSSGDLGCLGGELAA